MGTDVQMVPPCSSRRLRRELGGGLSRAVLMNKGTVRRLSPPCICSTFASRCFLLPLSYSESCMKTMPAFSVEEVVWKVREQYSQFLEIHVVTNRDLVTPNCG